MTTRSLPHQPLLGMSVSDQRKLLAHLDEAFPLQTGYVKVAADLLRAALREADAQLPRRLTEFDSEPPAGSVVMIHGLEGTAVQRFRADGLWHRGLRDPYTWHDMLGFVDGSGLWLILEGQPR